ncbi:glycerophosphodiester phosphodiesterase family protein [Acaryochloris sp. IP29b_bin.148]|uniref:glycerophosphodiester phosphodiesterase family protein n=1 Tax=Acaryochloris sp. IP29b_bin.148 TaxID=2969218 RepID=UPI0026086B71|nr:glycerophosphodiester phosphodiesterase family protein [Acaryochloris sp. IP29b_bin.148]
MLPSLDFDILRQVRTLDPGLMIGPVVPPARPEYPDFEVDFYSIHFTLATPERVKEAHAEGKAIHVWTVNQPDEMQRMIELGVDNIITDQLAVFQEL